MERGSTRTWVRGARGLGRRRGTRRAGGAVGSAPRAPRPLGARAPARTCRLPPRARPPLLPSRGCAAAHSRRGRPSREGRGRGAGGDTGCSGAAPGFPKPEWSLEGRHRGEGAGGRPAHRDLQRSAPQLVFSPFPGGRRDWHTPKLPLRFRLRPDRASHGRGDPEETGSALRGWRGRETLHSWKKSFRSPGWRDVPLTPRGAPRLGAS